MTPTQQVFKLQPGDVESLKVVDLKKRLVPTGYANEVEHKKIKKKDGLWYWVWDVLLEGKNKLQVWAEYVTTQEEPIVHQTFAIGVYQFIRCTFLSAKSTPEIEPSDDPGNGLGQRITPQRAAIDRGPAQNPDQANVNGYSVSVSGKSMTFAMGYAKDILCAEIALKHMAYETTEEDIRRMIRNAHTINEALTESLTF